MALDAVFQRAAVTDEEYALITGWLQEKNLLINQQSTALAIATKALEEISNGNARTPGDMLADIARDALAANLLTQGGQEG